MCVSCGCKDYENEHGDPANITLQELKDAATASKISIDELFKNLDDGYQHMVASSTGGQVE